jgi:hypothetical protein
VASIDVTRPNIARMYDYWLGGKDNFEADRQAARAVRERQPDVAELAIENKKFLTRAVRFVAGQGVRQFLDVGSGLPTSPVRESGAQPLWLSTHEAAATVVPDSVVAYVDYDQVAVLHSQALLTGGKRTVAVRGDMCDPKAILADEAIRAAGFELAEPACVILACVLHFADHGTASRIAAEFAGSLAQGSYLIVSVGYVGENPPSEDFVDAYNAQHGPRIYRQSREGVSAYFDGLELVPPGVVDAASWPAAVPGATRPERAATILAGVARVTAGG